MPTPDSDFIPDDPDFIPDSPAAVADPDFIPDSRPARGFIPSRDQIIEEAGRTGRVPYVKAAARSLLDARGTVNRTMTDLRERLAPKVGSYSEADILAEAEETGRVPYSKIVSRAAAEIPLTIATPTADELLLAAAAGPVIRTAGRIGSRILGPERIARLSSFLKKPRSFSRRPNPAATPAPEVPAAAGPEIPEELLVEEPAPPASAEPAVVFEQPPAPGQTALPRARPVFDTAAQREELVRRGIVEKEGERLRAQRLRLEAKVNRIKEIREGRAGEVPKDPRAVRAELELIRKDAEHEIDDLARGLHKEAKDVMGDASSLEEFVMSHGGVRPNRPDMTGKVPELEEWMDIPERFRSAKTAKAALKGKFGPGEQRIGHPADEMAQMAFEAGLLEEPSDILLRRKLAAMPKRTRAEAWQNYIGEAEHLATNPDAGAPLARRMVELRNALGGRELQEQRIPRRKLTGEADIRREIEKIGLEWEANRARLSKSTRVQTGNADMPETRIPDDIVESGGELELLAGEGTDTAAPAFAGNVRLSKFPEPDVRAKMREAAKSLGLPPEEPFGGVRSMEETHRMAEQLIARGVRGEDMLKVPRGTALNDSEMRVMQILTDDAFRKAANAENAALASMGQPGADKMFREADAAMRQATAMFERLSEFKTTSGRAVNIQKAMSPDKIDLPTEYMKRLAESERARGLVGQERIDFIRSQYEQFVKLPKEAQLELFEKEGAISGWEGFTNKWNAIVKPGLNIWRASLVSQLATAMRNFTSQGLAGVWNLFDDVVAAATGTIVEGVGGKGVTTAWKKHSAGMIEDVVSFARQFSPEDRKMLQQLLSSEAFAEVREKLIRTPVTMLEAQQRSPGAPAAVRKFQGFAAKYGDYLTFVNRLGETQERLYFFEAAFREQLRRTHPELLKTMDFKNLPFDQFRDVATMAANAADQALRLTFAKDFKGGAAGKFLEFTQQPVIDVLAATSGAATFPRFMANAFNWLYRHSPGPFLEIAMSQTNRKAFLAGNPEAVKAFSGAVTGSVLGFGAALKIRSDERLSEGARWYEIRLPNGKYLDTRAYAPLITPYLFTAELVLRGNRKVNWDDFREGILMTRLAGTGRFMAQLFSGRLSGQSASRLAVSAVGEFLGGFFQPINTIKDAVAGWNEEEAKFRDTKQNPILGPVMVKIPGLSRLLPEAVSPTRAGARKSESPWLRQMSGLTENSKNALEERLTEIGYPTGNLYPKMGEPRANWIVTKYLGEIAEERAPMLLQRLDSEVRKMREQGLGEKAINEIQRERVTQAYSNWKEVARRRALREDPALFRQVKDERARGSRKITLLRSGRAVR